MLRKKKPVLLWMITITDKKSKILYQGPLFSMQFAEGVIKALSMEFFHDPEPCQIHRSAVIQRAMMEIELICSEKTCMPLSALPLRIADFFSCYEEAHALTLGKEEKQA